MGFTEIDLSTCLLPGGWAVYDGTAIKGSTTTNFPDFIPAGGLALDPAKFYTFEFDVEPTPGMSTSAGMWVYSQLPGDPLTSYDASHWYRLGSSFGDGTGAAQAVTITVGPNRDQWNSAVSAGETNVLFEGYRNGLRITGARYQEVVLTYSDWYTDAEDVWATANTTSSVVRWSASGSSADLTDVELAAIWAGTSTSHTTVEIIGPAADGQSSAGLDAERTGDSSIPPWIGTGFYNQSWFTASRTAGWTVTSSSPGAWVAADPTVAVVDWEPQTVPFEQRLRVTFRSGEVAGELAHVKILDAAPASFTPGGAMAALDDFAVLPVAVDALIPNPGLPLTGAISVAVSLVDPLTQSQDATVTTRSGFSKSVRADGIGWEMRYRPRYRVGRFAPPVAPVPAVATPATRSTPSLRMLQRGGQGGMSGIPRMIGNPVRGLRQGPGSVY